MIKDYVLFSCELERALHGERDDHVSALLRSSRSNSQKYALLKIYMDASYDLNRLWPPYNFPLITKMVDENNEDAIKLLSCFLVDVNRAGGVHLVTPLARASVLGYCTMVESLLIAGADKEQACIDEVTPLLIAASRGEAEVVQLLVNAGADINRPTRSGSFTPSGGSKWACSSS